LLAAVNRTGADWQADGTLPYVALTPDADGRPLAIDSWDGNRQLAYDLTADFWTEGRLAAPCPFVADLVPLNAHATALWGHLLGDHAAVTRITTPEGGGRIVSYTPDGDALLVVKEETLNHVESRTVSVRLTAQTHTSL